MDAFGLAIGTFLLALPHLALAQGGLVAAWPGLPFPGELLAVIAASAAAPNVPKRLRTHMPAALLVAGGTLVLFEAWCLGQGHAGMNAIVVGLVEEILHGAAVALWVICLRLEDAGCTRKLDALPFVAAALGGVLWYVGMQELHLDTTFYMAQIDLISWGFTLVWSACAATFLMLTERGREPTFLATLAVFAGVLAGNRLWWVLDAFGVHVPISGMAIAAIAVLLMAAAAVLTRRLPAETPAPEKADEAADQQGLLSSERVHAAALTARERTVIEFALAGATVDETAEALGIARATAGTYRSRALAKLGMHSIQELLGEIRQLEGVSMPAAVDDAEPRPALWDARLAVAAASLVAIAALLRLLPTERLVNLVLILIFTCAFAAGLAGFARSGQASHPSNGSVPMLIGAACALIVTGCAFGPGIYLVRRIVISAFVCYATLLVLDTKDVPETLMWFGLTGLVLALPGPHVSVVVSSAGWATGSAAFFTLLAHLVHELKRERRLADLANATLAADGRKLAYLRGRGLGELEAQVALLTAQGFDRASIAKTLSISPSTVASYRSATYAALGINDRKALAATLSGQTGRSDKGFS